MKDDHIYIGSKKGSSLSGKIMVGVTILAIGAAGYIARDQMFKRGYVSPEAKLQVVKTAVTDGLSEKIIETVPEKDRYVILKKDFEKLPLDKKWDFVSPTLDKMVETQGSDNTVYKMLKDSFGRRENGLD